MKRAIRGIVLWLVIAFVCMGVAKELILGGIYHDALLLISGLSLGAFCFYFTWLTRIWAIKGKGDTSRSSVP